MRFTKIMCAAGAVGIVGALALGSATAANAATTAPAPKASTVAQGDRIQGPFDTFATGTGVQKMVWPTPSDDGTEIIGRSATSGGAVYTFPAVGSVGPISPADDPSRCLTPSGTKAGDLVFMQPCNGGEKQEWTVAADGAITSTWTERGLNGNGGTYAMNTFHLPTVIGGTYRLDLAGTEPVAPAVTDLTASVVSKDQDAKTAVIGGKGEPGADLTITNPDGSEQTVKVNEDGTWTATIPNLKTGDNSVKVKQTVGDNVQEQDLTVTMDEAPLTAEVISINPDDQSALIGGDAEPGAELVITNPDGSKQTITVPDSGKWEATIPGLKEGDNPVKVEQTVGDNTQTKDLVVTLLPSPIVNPAIAGGAGLAAIAALGTAIMIRRNKARA